MASSRIGLVCLLLVGTFVGQNTATAPELKARPAENGTLGPSNVAADTPVITVQGLCERPGAGSATPADCKTVITRADFEKLINTIQPNMPRASLKQFATRYVMALMVAEKAQEQGLEQSAEFKERMYLSRLQVLDVLASEQMQRESAKASDTEIEDYYHQHEADFKSLTYDKLFVPKQKQVDTSTQPAHPELETKPQAPGTEMQEEAAKLRARAAAGEDFAQLERDAYQAAGIKTAVPTTHFTNINKLSIPKTEAGLVDLKAGEVSPVLTTNQGFVVYKLDSMEAQPITAVRGEITRILQGEKLKTYSEQLQKSASDNTSYDDAYFSSPAPPTLHSPGEIPSEPASSPAPAPGKK